MPTRPVAKRPPSIRAPKHQWRQGRPASRPRIDEASPPEGCLDQNRKLHAAHQQIPGWASQAGQKTDGRHQADHGRPAQAAGQQQHRQRGGSPMHRQ